MPKWKTQIVICKILHGEFDPNHLSFVLSLPCFLRNQLRAPYLDFIRHPPPFMATILCGNLYTANTFQPSWMATNLYCEFVTARRGPPLVSSATSSDVETQDAGSVGVNTEELSIASAREAGCECLALNSSPSPIPRRRVVGGHCPRTCVRACTVF